MLYVDKLERTFVLCKRPVTETAGSYPAMAIPYPAMDDSTARDGDSVSAMDASTASDGFSVSSDGRFHRERRILRIQRWTPPPRETDFPYPAMDDPPPAMDFPPPPMDDPPPAMDFPYPQTDERSPEIGNPKSEIRPPPPRYSL
jgi:hypothetical protein